jgi:tetratricopeptide (TPR) repeat protein
LFPAQYDSLYKDKTASAVFELQKIISDNSILFVGFSLSDPYINHVFDFVSEVYDGYTPEHFIITSEDNKTWPKRITPINIDSYNETEATLQNILNKVAVEPKRDIKEKKSSDNSIASMTEISGIDLAPQNKILPDKKTELDDDIIEGVKLLSQLTKEIGYAPTKEHISKLNKVKEKLYNDIFSPVEDSITYVAKRDDLLISSPLFDVIYASSKLSTTTLIDIQSIRVNKDIYKYFDRSVIVSALTLSLINFKFDVKKAELLLDFVSDFEEGVWQRALTGLIISIMAQRNRSWQRCSSFIKRLTTLQTNQEIQNGIKLIDLIFRYNLYEISPRTSDIYQLPYFKNPINSFLPFYEKNEVLENALEEASIDFDIDHFTEYLKYVPLLDSQKYALCLGLSENLLEKVELTKNEQGDLRQSLYVTNNYNPYQNIISEFYCYFNGFPEKHKEDVFKKELQLNDSALKKMILNNKMKLLIEGNTLLKKEKFLEAIAKYESLISIDKGHKEAEAQLARCCYSLENYKKSAFHYKVVIENLGESASLSILTEYSRCLFYLDKHTESLVYCDRVIKKQRSKESYIYYLASRNYIKLNSITEAEEHCMIASDNAITEFDFFNLSKLYEELEKYEDAIVAIHKAISKAEKVDVDYLDYLADYYIGLYDWPNAIKTIKEGLNIDSKHIHLKFTLSRAYLLSGLHVSDSKSLLLNLLNKKDLSAAVVNGNLGHCFLLEGDKKQAVLYYQGCITLLKCDKDFYKRMNLDLKYLVKIGIDEIAYKEIRDTVIDSYLKLQTH